MKGRHGTPGLFAWIGLALGVFGCSNADLRPEELVESVSPQAEREGRAWIERAVALHGGLAHFRALQHAELELVDRWPGWFMRMLASPWDDEPQRMRLTVRLGADDSRIDFLSGPAAGTAWGLQQWVTYRANKTGTVEFDPVDAPDRTLKFWLPTVAYFPFAVFRLAEADAVAYAGEVEIGGQSLVRVMASWGTIAPQDQADQYILYLDRKTARLEWLQYTVREQMKSIAGTMRYSDWRTVEGLEVPFLMQVVDALGDTETSLHEFVIEKARFGPTRKLILRPDLAASK